MDPISINVYKAHLIKALHRYLIVIKTNHLENGLPVGDVSSFSAFEINEVKFEICGRVYLTGSYDNVRSTLNTDTFLALSEADCPDYISRNWHTLDAEIERCDAIWMT